MNHRYGQVTREVIEELIAFVGKKNVYTAKDEMEKYSYDETPHGKRYFPEVVVKPSDTGSVAKLLFLASERRIPVTPRGAGTGLTGGCVPICGGILLSLERMDRILEIDKSNSLALVEPGVTLSNLGAELEKQGLYYPVYPGEMTATIGGNAATNAGGMNAVKYGVTRHHILGLEAVLPGGEVIKTGGKLAKCSTGYDLTQLIVGSEGTLAVVTKIILKLTVKPAIRELIYIPFTDLQSAIDAVPEILRLNLTPIGIEFMEKSIVEIVEEHTGIELPYHDYEAFLMIIAGGESEDEIMAYSTRVDEICRRHGAVEAMLPGSERAKRRLLNAREKFYPAIRSHALIELVDVVVPRSEIANFVRMIKEISAKHEIPVVAMGHAGDGNVHLNPVCVNMDREDWDRKLPHLLEDIYRAGVSLGGAISGEHGIGFEKKAYVPIQMDSAQLGVMKAIKKAFDPNNILNPGKIFDL